MHCINVMHTALAPGDDRGVTILIGGKRTLKIGDMLSSMLVPFMSMKTPEDWEAFAGLVRRIWEFWTDNGLDHERVGEFIDRIGMGSFLDGVGIAPDPQMVQAAARQFLHQVRGIRTAAHRRRTARDSQSIGQRGIGLEKDTDASDSVKERLIWPIRPQMAPRNNGAPDYKPLLHPAMARNYGRWKDHQVLGRGVYKHIAEDGEELFTVRAGSPRMLSVNKVRLICDIADKYCEGHLRFTTRNNIEFLLTNEDDVEPLIQEIERCPGDAGRRHRPLDLQHPAHAGMAALQPSRHRRLRHGQGDHGHCSSRSSVLPTCRSG